MKIALISREKLENRVYWSGIIETVYSNLKLNKKIEIVKIDNLNNSLRKIHALKREFINFLKKEKYDDAYNENVSKNFARQIKLKLSKYEDINYILCFDSSLIAYLNIKKPIILWTDLLYSDYYSHYYKDLKVSQKTFDSIKLIEKNALNKCHRIFLSSEWAIKKAIKKHKKNRKKFKYLPFGPNFKISVNKKKINNYIKSKSQDKLTLITLSVDWRRKGLNKLLELKKILNKKGVRTRLIVIGLKKKIKTDEKDVKFIKFIDKSKLNGEIKLSNYLLRSHYHVLFSNAEAYGVSLVEANSRGLPNIVFKVGGIPQIVKNNVNGMIFKKNTSIDQIALKIKKNFSIYKNYEKLSISSYHEYNKNFCYKKIINDFIKFI